MLKVAEDRRASGQIGVPRRLAFERTRSQIMGSNVRRYLQIIGKSQAELARWWGCDPTFVNQVCQGRRALGDKAARKIIEFFGLHGLVLTQAHLMATSTPVQGGRWIKVLGNLKALAGLEMERSRALREEYTITSDAGAFFLEAHGPLVGGIISDGDLLKVEPQAPVDAGNYVLCEVDGVVQVRRVALIRLGESGVMLLESPRYEPAIQAIDGQKLFRITAIQKNI